ncbi:hypothetical protein MOO45_02900 [Bombilactobacillus folatiphilus]|uniref:Uncharacterized protein n=1 Tax=Bombilactobacillus folatiphilus TaxID=2923362 RepID=A0ABY4PAH8_9LACO|nr:hypothetical protein [Bombilactobacillus folatiphilus]UQS82612.1 hypothetical protein MOO45_02900 [Bombilactobacillus folatiphilus]
MLRKQEKIINLTGQSLDENKNRLATFSAVIYSDSNHYSITQSVDAVIDGQKKQVDTDFKEFKASVEAVLDGGQ